MICQKEEANGCLYQMCLYSTGYVPGASPRQRRERYRFTAEAKQKINAMQRKWRVMQLLCANFIESRDLFVCLTYAEAPENEGRDIERFHRAARRLLKKLEIEHTYMVFPACHDLPDCEVRTHFHVVMRGALGPGMFHKLQALVQDCWPFGRVDVRPLRQDTDFFEDTAEYLLDQPGAKGKRAYSCSRNLCPPNEPVRLRLPDEESGQVPPGVKILDDKQHDNQYGSYRYLVGYIYDQKAFNAYWTHQRKRAAPDPWERLRRRRRGAYTRPAAMHRCG